MSKSKWLVAFVLVAVALMGSLPAAAEGPRFTATFTLPFAATWGSTQLQPGTYRISCAVGCSSGVLTLTPAEGGRQTFILGQLSHTAAPTNRSALSIENIGEQHAVHTLQVGDVELIYAVPKAHGRAIEAKKHAPTYIALKGK